MQTNKVKILENNVISRIAAGEIIERPSSVVKELVENSIDAGADEVEVFIDDAGKKMISITDNGEGMSEEDLMTSVERHATSKISDDSDLYKISTFGFRGEALPSIASVSRMTILTLRDNDEAGHQMQIVFGKKGKTKKAAGLKGTQITVENLFENVPVRKRFMKSSLSEKRQIENVMKNFAFAHPEVTFVLKDPEKVIAQYEKVTKPEKRFREVIGPDVFSDMERVSYSSSDIRVTGYISRPTLVRHNRSGIRFFVNKRPVGGSDLFFTLSKFYSDKIPKGKHPEALIFITIDPDKVDVNIHPTKREIKFRDSGRVFTLLLKSYSLAFKGVSLAQEDQPLTIKTLFSPSFSRDDYPRSTPSTGDDLFREMPPLTELEEETAMPFRITGQIGRGYVLLEDMDGIEIIDQHAAHERVLYERIKKRYEENNILSQELLIPDIVELEKSDADLIRENLEGLKKIGFIMDVFGEASFKVDAVPVDFSFIESQAFFMNYLSSLSDEGRSQDTTALEKIFRMACRSAVMVGDEMTAEEMRALVSELYKTENRYTCPHGRPIVKRFTWKELRGFFKRQ